MCEVALGNSQGLTAGVDVVNVPNAAFQSVHGMGYYSPNYQYIDGILAPFSGLVASNIPSALHYNEYIVYNPNQVKIKYLLKMKFNYKWFSRY